MWQYNSLYEISDADWEVLQAYPWPVAEIALVIEFLKSRSNEPISREEFGIRIGFLWERGFTRKLTTAMRHCSRVKYGDLPDISYRIDDVDSQSVAYPKRRLRIIKIVRTRTQ